MSEKNLESEVGKRYAKALFSLCLEKNALESVMKDLVNIRAIIHQSPQLSAVLGSVLIAPNQKHKALLAVCDMYLKNEESLNALSNNFLGVLSHNKRANALMSVIVSFEAMHKAHLGIVDASVASAVALSDGQLTALTDALSKALGQTPVISTRVDPELLGGLKVRIGSRLYDSSLKTKLDSLKFALKRA